MHTIFTTVAGFLLVLPAAETLFAQETLAALAGESKESRDGRVLNQLFGPEFIAENVRAIRRRALRLPVDERFDYLADWVLPGPNHSDFRVSAEFTPTDPSPLAVELEPDRFGPEGRGGELVSPVFDLLDAAIATGRLDELRARIADTPEPEDEYQRRSRAALESLAALEAGDTDAALAPTDRLHALALHATPEREADMWPETLALHRGLQSRPPLPAVREMLGSLYSQRTDRGLPPGCENWHARLVWLMESWRLRERLQNQQWEEPLALDEWIPVRRTSARPRGLGYPQSHWGRVGPNEVWHLRGHHEDYLFFRSPLRGDFEVAGEMRTELTTQLFAAGRYFGPRVNPEQLEVGDFRTGSLLEPIAPPFGRPDPWVRFRAVVRDGVRTIWLNGRPVHSEPLPEHHDPWFGVRAWSRAVGKLRHVQVIGSPEIPDAVHLSASPVLTGWVPYYEEPAGHEGAIWQHALGPDGAGEIHARRHDGLAGSSHESLLGYHRPLVEGGAVEYEFFYKPGRIEAHPALDRLAFILAPEGVRIHWVTDGNHDQTDVPPGNIVDEPQNRRGPDKLPLKLGDWNHMRLSLTGDVVALELNGELTYERVHESTNRRTFGLFHFGDRTDLRVRNVVLRGNWPKTLPSPVVQELADPALAWLDADLPKLKAVFTHDFAADGLPDRYFKRMEWDGGQFTLRPDGVHVLRPGGEWKSAAIRLPFSAVGDFDIEASFDQLQLNADIHSCILLQAALDDERQHWCRLLRILHRQNHHEVDPSLAFLRPDGQRTYTNEPVTSEALAGRLRIARRGNKVCYLFAEADSPAFRLVGTHVVTDAPLIPEGIDLTAMANGSGETQVVWKSVTVRAEQLKYLLPDPQPAPRRLHVMHADGTDLRQVLAPPGKFTHLGSPEWSPDGRRIALDVSRGTVSTSHIFVVNVDGTKPTDLGPGCMPSFSNDSRRIVLSESGRGIVMMNADGSNRRVVDSGGWGVQWSPDGRHLAYGKSGNIVLREVDSGKERDLLRGDDATRYSSIVWNLGWSHDSRRIAFKGRLRETGIEEVAVIDVGPPHRLTVLHSPASGINADFTWSPDSEQVLFSMHSPEHKGHRLFLSPRNEPGSFALFPNQPSDQWIYECAWSRHGLMAFCGERMHQPQDWPAKTAREP